MSIAYDNYLTQHKDNVYRGYEWIKANLPEILLPGVDYEWQLRFGHDHSKDMVAEYEPYDKYFYGGNLGQIAIGDSDNFLRYYETEEGTYELEISTVQELDDSLRGAIAEQNTSITQNCETIILSALDSHLDTL